MSISAIAKGITIGLAAGAITYTISNATGKQMKKVKNSAGKAIRAIGDVVDGISYMLH